MKVDLAPFLQKRLSRRRRSQDPQAAARHAAVLVPLFCHQEAYHLLFTQRTTRLKTHSGEVAFPGGLCQKGDASPLETALREAEEEIGLKPKDVQVLGLLDDIRTRSTNYVVTPVVGLVPYPYLYRLDPKEVAAIFSVPLSFLQDPKNLTQETWFYKGEAIPMEAYYYREYRIWGATQRITQNLLEILRDEKT